MFSSCSSFMRAQLTAEKVTVEHAREPSDKTARTIYSLSDGMDHAELVVDRVRNEGLKPELRFNVWQGDVRTYRESAALPIDRRLAFFHPLMERFLATEKPEPEYGLLFYGYRELYERLPGLAAEDPHWNRQAGRPNSKIQVYVYLRNLLNTKDAYRELAEAATSFHCHVTIAGGMEELRVLPVSKLTEGQRKHLTGEVKETDLLPARVAVDFKLTRDK